MKTVSEPRSRGQVMVLGCVALTVCALMLMISFNFSNAVHERVPGVEIATVPGMPGVGTLRSPA